MSPRTDSEDKETTKMVKQRNQQIGLPLMQCFGYFFIIRLAPENVPSGTTNSSLESDGRLAFNSGTVIAPSPKQSKVV